jgi:hypothetical protein
VSAIGAGNRRALQRPHGACDSRAMRKRSLLALGAVSVAAVAVAGGTLALLKPGLHEARLSDATRDAFAGVGCALLDGSLPTGKLDLAGALDALLGRIEVVVSMLAPHAQSELSQLLAFVAHGGGRRALAGYGERGKTASVPDIG